MSSAGLGLSVHNVGDGCAQVAVERRGGRGCWRASRSAGGRIRLPTNVVRIRSVLRFTRWTQRKRVGHISVRHMCATGLLSKPRPSFGLAEVAAQDVFEFLERDHTFGSNEYRSFTQIRRLVMYHLWFSASL